MHSLGYQMIFQTDDLRITQHISKVLREKYGENLLSSQAEVVAGSAALTLLLAKGHTVKLHQLFELAALEAKRFGTALARSRFTTPVPLEVLLESLQYFLKLEGLEPDQVVYPQDPNF